MYVGTVDGMIDMLGFATTNKLANCMRLTLQQPGLICTQVNQIRQLNIYLSSFFEVLKKFLVCGLNTSLPNQPALTSHYIYIIY